MAKKRRSTRKKQPNHSRRQLIRVDELPDVILLEIFDFYTSMYKSSRNKRKVEAWQSLVHVCRQWRQVVFQSPRRLHLQLLCSPETPARDTLDVWPTLPLIVMGFLTLTTGTDNLVAALGQSNSVREVHHWDLAGWQLGNIMAPMQVPFPELTDIRLAVRSNGETVPVIPESFLGGSAPRLRIFHLDGVPFPGLPKLHLSPTHLVNLKLQNVPHSGYISPKAMVTLLSELTSLEVFSLEFQSPQSCPDQQSRSLPPPKRSILPAFHEFRFHGVTEYLEELVTHIDTPKLDHMHIIFFNQIDYDCPRLAQFIDCTPELRELDEVHVQFDTWMARITLQYLGSDLDDLQIDIICQELDWQLSAIEQVCSTSLRLLSKVEDLYIERRNWQLDWKDDAIENALWLQLFRPFTGVKDLYLSEELAPGIAAVLQESVGGVITEVLPSLQNIFVEGLEPSGPFQKNIEKFITARQLSDHPIAISIWHKFSYVMRQR